MRFRYFLLPSPLVLVVVMLAMRMDDMLLRSSSQTLMILMVFGHKADKEGTIVAAQGVSQVSKWLGSLRSAPVPTRGPGVKTLCTSAHVVLVCFTER